jgi:hypothetical protein
MSMPTQPGVRGRTDEPMVLWNRVVEARSEMSRARQLPGGTARSAGRAEFLSALEAYVASLTKRGRPIPYALRDELLVHRLTRHG